MKSNSIKIIVIIFAVLLIVNCSSSDSITVEVHKSAFIPDEYELDRDSLIYGGIRICTMAMRYYHKPTLLLGGGNSFEGFAIPKYLYETGYGYYILKVKNNKVKVIGKGKLTGYDEINPMEVHLVVTPKYIESSVIIN